MMMIYVLNGRTNRGYTFRLFFSFLYTHYHNNILCCTYIIMVLSVKNVVLPEGSSIIVCVAVQRGIKKNNNNELKNCNRKTA